MPYRLCCAYRAFCLAKTGVRTASKLTMTMLAKTKTWMKRRHSMHYKLSTFSLLLSHKAGKEIEILACVAADRYINNIHLFISMCCMDTYDVSVSLISSTRALVEQDLSLFVSFIETDSSICSNSTPSITINYLCIHTVYLFWFCARGSGKRDTERRK